MSKIRMAVYGTKHSHSSGVLKVMLANPDVEVAGVYEPDIDWRKGLQNSGGEPWSQVRWFDSKDQVLEDETIVAVASEGANIESLEHTEALVEAGKHIFYDKPAGEDFARFERVIYKATEKGLLIQLGYMYRYHDGFTRIADWARSGFLGHIYKIRADMSTSTTRDSWAKVARHRGGIFYDLASHMIDQIVWILGRPQKVTSFMRRDVADVEDFRDNTLGVLEYERAMAMVDIAAMEPRPAARRFEVFGTEGSAIMEPFEPAETLRLCMAGPTGEYPEGVTIVNLEHRPRYVGGLEAFIKDIQGEKQPDRSLQHELLVQETLLRASGNLNY